MSNEPRTEIVARINLLRHTPAAAVLVLAGLLTACDPGISVRVDNRSDVPICLYVATDGRPEPLSRDDEFCFSSVDPDDDPDYSVLCFGGDRLWIVLSMHGKEIYARSAKCKEWEESGAWVRVERQDDEFLITDSFGNSRSEP